MAKLESQPFTIVAVEDSDYEGNPGVRITTKESYSIDGKLVNKFHSTRTAIVNKLRVASLREALKKGDVVGPVLAKQVQAKKGGKPYYDLVEAN